MTKKLTSNNILVTEIKHLKEILERVEESNNTAHSKFDNHLTILNGQVAKHSEYIAENKDTKKKVESHEEWINKHQYIMGGIMGLAGLVGTLIGAFAFKIIFGG